MTMTFDDTFTNNATLIVDTTATGNSSVTIALDGGDDAVRFTIAPGQLPNVMLALTGLEPTPRDLSLAREIAGLVESGTRGTKDVIEETQTNLLALAMLQERQEIIDAEIIDYIDDMSRDEAIALAKQLRDQTTPQAMATWAAANPEQVAMLTREPETSAYEEQQNKGCSCGH